MQLPQMQIHMRGEGDCGDGECGGKWVVGERGGWRRQKRRRRSGDEGGEERWVLVQFVSRENKHDYLSPYPLTHKHRSLPAAQSQGSHTTHTLLSVCSNHLLPHVARPPPWPSPAWIPAQGQLWQMPGQGSPERAWQSALDEGDDDIEPCGAPQWEEWSLHDLYPHGVGS